MPRHIPARFAVELPVDHDLLQRRIEAAQLRAPDATAPAKSRLRQRVVKIARVQPLEQLVQIVMRSRRPMLHAPRAPLPQRQQAPPRVRRA